MNTPKKPVVFLSHSSKDKVQLATLKELLDVRAAGGLEFFLSSDGESIPFGRNWVSRIGDALSESRLMFVFLSPRSADSKWIHFEAGYAYRQKVQVVPVCLPGIDLNQMTHPLSLLQGFNLHSHHAMGNLARICNDAVGFKINESFSEEDFRNVFGIAENRFKGFFGKHALAVEKIAFHTKIESEENANIDLIPSLVELAKAAQTECTLSEKAESGQIPRRQVDLPGCCVEVYQQVTNYGGRPSPIKETSVSGAISPGLFHLSAPILDAWFKGVGIFPPWQVSINLARQYRGEGERHHLTSKLFQSGIRLSPNSKLEFEGLTFELGPHLMSSISFDCEGKLEDERLPRLLTRLFDIGVFFEAPPRQPGFDPLLTGLINY